MRKKKGSGSRQEIKPRTICRLPLPVLIQLKTKEKKKEGKKET
jgi:hypothetical protein